MILKIPVPLSTLGCISVPCSMPIEAKEVNADLMSLAAQARAYAIQQLNATQPGGALVATPGAQNGAIQIVCHKVQCLCNARVIYSVAYVCHNNNQHEAGMELG